MAEFAFLEGNEHEWGASSGWELLRVHRGEQSAQHNYDVVRSDLLSAARDRGFVPGTTTIPVERDQSDSSRWRIQWKVPPSPAPFVLAIVAPRVPTIAPLPCQQTVRGPLFSVTVMPDFFVTWEEQGGARETKDENEVLARFYAFLESVSPRKAAGS